MDLEDIQGNIVRGYQYRHALHVFCEVRDPALLRAELRGVLPEVTTAARWARGQRPSVALNLAFSHQGIRRVAQAPIGTWPTAFRQGMRARAQRLGDRVADFDRLFRGDNLDLWISLHADSVTLLQNYYLALRERCRQGVRFLPETLGAQRLYHRDGYAIEHFGFRYGISNPSIAGVQKPRGAVGGTPRLRQWQPVAPGEFLLGHRDESGTIPRLVENSGLAQNGTFVVLRKLEQRVAAFQRLLRTQAVRLGQDEMTIAARMVGRKPDGTPLCPHRDLNDFVYADDPHGAACPLGAHIRRVARRDADGVAGLAARRRILRRSMPYGPAAQGTEEDGVQRGLLFVCMNASIERQFEYLQSRLINDGGAVHQGTDRDPLVGAHQGRAKFVMQGDAASGRIPAVCTGLEPFVECRGGGYFFMPGVEALRRLLWE